MAVAILPWPHAPGSIVRIYDVANFDDLAPRRQHMWSRDHHMTEALNHQRLLRFAHTAASRIRDSVVAGFEIDSDRRNTELTLVRPDDPSIGTRFMLHGPRSLDHSRDSLV
jgi:hypothetical protein